AANAPQPVGGPGLAARQLATGGGTLHSLPALPHRAPLDNDTAGTAHAGRRTADGHRSGHHQLWYADAPAESAGDVLAPCDSRRGAGAQESLRQADEGGQATPG